MYVRTHFMQWNYSTYSNRRPHVSVNGTEGKGLTDLHRACIAKLAEVLVAMVQKSPSHFLRHKGALQQETSSVLGKLGKTLR